MAPSDSEHEAEELLPVIEQAEPFGAVVRKLSIYILDSINFPNTFEQLRTTSAGNKIRILVDHLVANVTNPAIINALLTLKWHFSSLEPDDRGLNETRANACEIVAWRFLTRLSERDAMDFCLYELPAPTRPVVEESIEVGNGHGSGSAAHPDETSRLLPQFRARDPQTIGPFKPSSKRAQLMRTVTHLGNNIFGDDESINEDEEDDPTSTFVGLSALEIAAVADAKKFLSQRLVQKIIYGIWTGEISFWESLSVHTVKKPQFYNKKTADPFSRLRVPQYIKAFEVLFFAIFLAIYYAVLVERNQTKITPLEILLYIWVTAFAYDELSEFLDAGLFYYTDFWSSWDLSIILCAVAFLVTRVIGLLRGDSTTTDLAFDILSLEALFLIPRICSLLSLIPYFGTLIPCLKEMTKDFVKFMAVVAILYLGFLTTFSMLARDHFTLKQISWILIKVFFGSSYLGFDIMNDISPQFGPPLMLIFVCLTNILLVTSLISILSNSFSKVVAHAREEYLYVYSVYVLEASTSNRLTHFYPPLNLIPLVLIRPLRLFIPAERLRSMRIVLLKATHTPIVGAIWVYETVHARVYGERHTFSSVGPGTSNSGKLQRPFLASRTSVHSGVRDTPRRTESKRSRRDGTEGSPELQARVADLGAKIEELTALIMSQQGKGGDD